MNKTIEKLTAKLERVRAESSARITKLKEELDAAWKRVFERDKALEAAMTSLEERRAEYGCDEGGYYVWARFEADSDYPVQTLDSYLSESSYRYDHANHALMMYLGGCLVVLDGGVYDTDSDKWVIGVGEYGYDENKRDALIEAWMERAGYFPDVLLQDVHGNVSPLAKIGGAK
jgi:hypothetical protein